MTTYQFGGRSFTREDADNWVDPDGHYADEIQSEMLEEIYRLRESRTQDAAHSTPEGSSLT